MYLHHRLQQKSLCISMAAYIKKMVIHICGPPQAQTMTLVYDGNRRCGRCGISIPDMARRRGRMVRPRVCAGCIARAAKSKSKSKSISNRDPAPAPAPALSYAERVSMGRCGACGTPLQPGSPYKSCMRCRVRAVRRYRERHGVDMAKPLPMGKIKRALSECGPEPPGLSYKELHLEREIRCVCVRCGGERDREDRKQCHTCRGNGAARAAKHRSRHGHGHGHCPNHTGEAQTS